MIIHHVLAILSLLHLSLALIAGANPSINARSRNISPARSNQHRRAPSLPPAVTSLTSRDFLDLRDRQNHRTPNLRVKRTWRPRSAKPEPASAPPLALGGVDLAVRARAQSGLRKRAYGNGTIVALGNTADTYIVPVSLGDVTYPLQLDTASSDILVASTLCSSSSCPVSGGTSVNPYYDVSHRSSTFQSVNSNGTKWSASYGDETAASGFIARELVTLGSISVEGQVFGMINSTNLTLSDQKMSGILGLGFPRLSVLARALLATTDSTGVSSTSSSSSTSSGSASASFSDSASSSASSSLSSSSASSSSSSSSSPYLSPLLESLVTLPRLPYPVFGLALAPPQSGSTSTSTSAAAASSSSRYSLNTGSLTLGGVSSQYVSDNTTSGRTLGDIEWWDVVPFGTSSNATTTTLVDTVPATIDELDAEPYLYWALELANVAVNGTSVGINSSYASIGLPSIALLDAGTNGIYGPQQDVEKLFALITDARQVATGQWAVPCDADVTLGFSFGGRYVQLQPSDWMYAAITGSSFCLAWPVAVEDSGDGIDWQLGTPFLKNVYSVFSYGIDGGQAPLVGFLPLTDTNSTQAASPTPSSVKASPSLTATVATTLPNALLPDPTFPTPSYAFASTLSLGSPQNMGLANSSAYAVSAAPVVTPATASSSSLSGASASSSSLSSTGSTGSATTGDNATSAADRMITRCGSLALIYAAVFAAVFVFGAIP